MSKLAARKTKARAETSAVYRGRPLVIELGLYSLTIREKGRRHGYEVPYAAIYETGGKLAARLARAAKLSSKRAIGGRKK